MLRRLIIVGKSSVAEQMVGHKRGSTFDPLQHPSTMNEAAKAESQMLYQMYMNGAHSGDAFIQAGYNHWIANVEADVDGHAARFGTDPQSLLGAIEDARRTQLRHGAGAAAERLERYFRQLAG